MWPEMGQEVKDHLRNALSLMFKPLIRLLIAQGVTHAEFSETAKEVYVETALRHFETDGRINKSRVAILTGLTRKEVKNVVDRALELGYREKPYSRPERVLTGWYSDPKFQGPYGIPLELPYDSNDEDEKSFIELVRQYSGDMAPRQMLNQLVEAGSVIEVDGRYKPVRRDFKHSKLTPELIERLGRVGYRVFSTAAKNIDKEAEASGHFDRMVSADEGCTDDVLELFDEYIKSHGQAFLEEIDVWFSSRKDKNPGPEPRKETGLYMVHYVEDEGELVSLRDLLKIRGLEPNN
jgi:DNA-binding Lrp family transcriptional regulator